MRLWIAVMVAMGLLAPDFADARVVVRSAEQLSKLKGMRELRSLWAPVSAAMVVYGSCTEHYEITDEQKQFIYDLYARVWEDYNNAYRNAYEHKVGAPPDPSMVGEYNALITAEQKLAADNMYTIIAGDGCDHFAVRNIYKSMEIYRAQAEHAKTKQGSH